MSCPICQRRKPQRYCPAKAEDICSVCCGTEREVTIDCLADCPYLIASRKYDSERREIDWSKVPFPETRIATSFVAEHGKLLAGLSFAVCIFARDNPSLVDADVIGALQSLAESYRTLATGLIYEKPPDYRLQRELYEKVKTAIEEYRKTEDREAGAAVLRDREIRDALIFLAQLGATRTNGRPKGRAYLDFLRGQFKPEEVSKPASNIVLLP